MSKYLNKKTTGNFKGELVKFDSKKEAEHGFDLMIMEKTGLIQDLERQVSFTLIEKSKYGKAIKYVADFVYYKNNKLVVEDVKSAYTRKDKVYRLKKRLMAEKYGIEIQEV